MGKMVISEIKAKRVYAEPEKYCYVAEAVVEENGEDIYVAMQKYDGYDMTVSKQSMYKFISGDGGDVAEEFVEDYRSEEEASGSKYADVFELLKDVMVRLG